MLSDAELLLGLGRHLSAYTISPAHAALASLHFGGQVYELAWRLRGSQISSMERIGAIAVEARIGIRPLLRDVLPTMEQLDWVSLQRDDDGQISSVEALIPPSRELVAEASRLLDLLMVSPIERAALELLRATTRQPLSREQALQAAASFGDEAAEDALRHLVAVHLVREVELEAGRPVVFNPNVWVDDASVAIAALRAEDARVSSEVGALIEEIEAKPGIPESQITSTDVRWIDFAVSQGLVQRSVVQTSKGDEQRFLFTPHLHRDAFGVAKADPSGHVRQLVGSMIYATTFASWKLQSPGAFLHTLIRDGEAGNAPNIGTDYPMLETAGTIRIEPGASHRSFRMVLLQSDVAEAALDIMDSRGVDRGERGSIRALGDQRSYSHIEQERAKMALTPSTGTEDVRRLIDALRDVTAKRDFT